MTKIDAAVAICLVGVAFGAGILVDKSCQPHEKKTSSQDGGVIDLLQADLPQSKLSCPAGLQPKEFQDETGALLAWCEDDKGARQGETIDHWLNGNLKRKGVYKDDRWSGPFNKYWENGKAAEEGIFEDDNRIGRWRYWSEKGQLLSDGNYKDDKPVGKFSEWYADGTKKAEGEYDAEGEQTNEWTLYSPNGKQLTRGKFEKGQRVGVWKDIEINGKELFSHDFGSYDNDK